MFDKPTKIYGALLENIYTHTRNPPDYTDANYSELAYVFHFTPYFSCIHRLFDDFATFMVSSF